MENRYMDTPQRELEGLTPRQVEKLLGLFEEGTPLRVEEVGEEHFERLPLLGLVTHFLKAAQEGVKLTQAGYLPTALVKELYEARYVMDVPVSEERKLIKEMDVMVAHLARTLCEVAELVQVEKSNLRLTEEGKYFLENPAELFEKILKDYITELSWSYFDGLPECDEFQSLAGYLLFLVRKYGRKKMSVEFYYNKFMQIFPEVKEEFLKEHTEEELFTIFYVRIFERFLEIFGLVEVLEGNGEALKRFKILKTELFDKMISFEI